MHFQSLLNRTYMGKTEQISSKAGCLYFPSCHREQPVAWAELNQQQTAMALQHFSPQGSTSASCVPAKSSVSLHVAARMCKWCPHPGANLWRDLTAAVQGMECVCPAEGADTKAKHRNSRFWHSFTVRCKSPFFANNGLGKLCDSEDLKCVPNLPAQIGLQLKHTENV